MSNGGGLGTGQLLGQICKKIIILFQGGIHSRPGRSLQGKLTYIDNAQIVYS